MKEFSQTIHHEVGGHEFVKPMLKKATTGISSNSKGIIPEPSSFLADVSANSFLGCNLADASAKLVSKHFHSS